MQNLGQTRSCCASDHFLLTPDTFVRTPLPGLQNGVAITHVSPAAGARFTQYTVEFDANGRLAPAETQRFLYVLGGEVGLDTRRLSVGSYAYLPAGCNLCIGARGKSRVAIVEKPYRQLPDVSPPALLTGSEHEIHAESLMGDPDIQVRCLLPSDAAFDFAVNTMEYRPGASLPMVEIHVMEHGLLMLAGSGIYRLGNQWYPVTAGDFIFMAPFCPQWFGALGKTPAKYLIYKDWNR